MSSFKILDVAAASRMEKLLPSDLYAIQKLSAIGYQVQDILQHISNVGKGGSSSITFTPGVSKPKTVQAYSFLKDSNQYKDQYGMEHSVAADLLDKLTTDPQSVASAIHRIVTETDSRKRQSQRVVRVTLDGAPSAKVPGAPASGDDGGFKALGEIISKAPVVYGMHSSFAVVDRNIAGAERFQIDLGGGLLVLAQSKRVAERAAKVVSIDGRSVPQVARHVRVRGPGGVLLTSSNIPANYWDGRRGPFEPMLPDPDVDQLTGLTSTMNVARRAPQQAEESDDESDDDEVKKPATSSSPRQSVQSPGKPSTPPKGKAAA